ncbi:hypothetical protein HBZS_118910 [Helicobacter bizzozeronii CCUG 35545]|nr:hypothetical protein HBZS_118910 [Helicobacter bizzozeronii CCUG 35545]
MPHFPLNFYAPRQRYKTTTITNPDNIAICQPVMLCFGLYFTKNFFNPSLTPKLKKMTPPPFLL